MLIGYTVSLMLPRLDVAGADAGFGIQAQLFFDVGDVVVNRFVIVASTPGTFDEVDQIVAI